MRDYKREVEPFINQKPKIILPQESLDRAKEFARRVVEKKAKEVHHQIDANNTFNRFLTGILGELAIEKYYDIEFIDWSVGDSEFYNISDLQRLKLNIGIKTVEFAKFHIIHKQVKRPELLIIRQKEELIFCGLATINCLETFQDDGLILDVNLRNRNTKSGFYGYQYLIDIPNFNDLKKYG